MRTSAEQSFYSSYYNIEEFMTGDLVPQMAVSRGDERGFVSHCRWCGLLEVVVSRNLIGAGVGVFHPRGSVGEVHKNQISVQGLIILVQLKVTVTPHNMSVEHVCGHTHMFKLYKPLNKSYFI